MDIIAQIWEERKPKIRHSFIESLQLGSSPFLVIHNAVWYNVQKQN
jgi:hypothetical protein